MIKQMEITLNGELKQFTDSINVLTMLNELQIDTRQVAVERNLEIIPKSLYEVTTLENGDKIEIVEFIGGG